MSNSTTSVVLSNQIGIRLNPLEANFMILSAFRQAFCSREDVEKNLTATFLIDRITEIDASIKAQIIDEINIGLRSDSSFSDRDIERWLIVSKKLETSLPK